MSHRCEECGAELEARNSRCKRCGHVQGDHDTYTSPVTPTYDPSISYDPTPTPSYEPPTPDFSFGNGGGFSGGGAGGEF